MAIHRWFEDYVFEVSDFLPAGHCDELVAHAERHLGIKLGESTADGRILLKREEECLAACTGAPMMMIDHHFHEHLTPETVVKLLDDLN